jgi:hypothetical protein
MNKAELVYEAMKFEENWGWEISKISVKIIVIGYTIVRNIQT